MSAHVFAPDRLRPRAEATRRVLQRKGSASGSHKGEAPPIVHEVLSSSGQALPGSARAVFEPRFGHDFSGVRVHADDKAAASARAVGADAYTAGSHIAFAAGKWDQAAANGLLAHELAHVVQQTGQAVTGPEPLMISDPNGAAEREAESAVTQMAENREMRPRERVSPRLFRQTAGGPGDGLQAVSTARVTIGAQTPRYAAATSLSWISSFAPAGLLLADGPTPATISAGYATGSAGFRFSNHVHGWVKSSDGVHISDSGFSSDSGLSAAPSFLGISSLEYAPEQNSKKVTVQGREAIQFDQLVGARTVSAAVIGNAVGGGVGGAVGSSLDAAAAKLARRFGFGSGEPSMTENEEEGPGFFERMGQSIGGSVGTVTANRLTNFPPIWTRVRLTLKANGESDCQLLEKSLFPSVSFYCNFTQQSVSDALWTEQGAWSKLGWDGGNPWGEPRPTSEP